MSEDTNLGQSCVCDDASLIVKNKNSEEEVYYACENQEQWVNEEITYFTNKEQAVDLSFITRMLNKY
ncbi:hypothetical protein PMALA_057080 [Plasmodium malariae]|uniref:Uncharacterized protein n=1 Tax=Plasmodium malariae TaxID=5858 RepID=A0A1A8WZF1_PLAMA|nr:hypothetical protein PMALA_057080 [Plasmodium malariae]